MAMFEEDSVVAVTIELGTTLKQKRILCYRVGFSPSQKFWGYLPHSAFPLNGQESGPTASSFRRLD